MDKPPLPQPEVPEENDHLLPKLEDLAALTGLFNPENIIAKFGELEDMDDLPGTRPAPDSSE